MQWQFSKNFKKESLFDNMKVKELVWNVSWCKSEEEHNNHIKKKNHGISNQFKVAIDRSVIFVNTYFYKE
jgi:hypothetical protein